MTKMARCLAFLVPLLLICCCCLTPPCVATRVVRIAAMVNTDSRIGREQMVALKMAAKDLNSSTSAVLFLNLTSSYNSDPLKELATVQNLITWGADAIISTGTWPETVAVAKLASRSNVPVISLAAAAPLVLPSIPYLLQMSYPTSAEVRCIADMAKAYSWRRVVVIYQDDDYGSVARDFALLSNALRDDGLEIDYHVAFPTLDAFPDPEGIVRKKLTSIPKQTSKVFVVLRSSRSFAINLFQVAKELELMEEGHVWIVGDDVAALVDSTLSPSFISSYMQGAIAVKPYVNESAGSYLDFSSKFRKAFRSEYENMGEQHFDPGVHAVRAYDALNLIARTAANTASRPGTKQKTLFPAMLSSSFTGLSGRIAFGTDGTLQEGKGGLASAYRVLNVVGRSYRELGFWLDGHGFYKDAGKLRRREPADGVGAFGSVYWPGGRAATKAPGGWGKLKIGLPNHTTFEQFVTMTDDDGNVDNYTGFCIDVFKEILKNLEYDLNFEFVRFNRSDSYDDLVNEVARKEFDAVVGDITILAKRMENVTFTQPYLSSGLSMMVPAKVNGTTWMLTKPFSKEVWLTILATLLFTTFIVWYLEHGSNNPEFHGPRTEQIGATFWFIISTIFSTHGRIYGNYTRVVVAVWLLVMLILTTCFTANLSSILTIQKLEPLPPGNTVGCDGDSFVVKYLKQALRYNKDKIVTIEAVDSYTRAFRNNTISGAYLELPYLKVFLSQHDDFTVYGELYRLGGFGFVFPKGSPLADDFSRIILQLAENGTLKDLENKWFKFQLTVSPGPNNDRSTESITLRSLWALFVLTVGTSTVVCAIFKIHSLLLIHGNNMKLDALRESFKRLTYKVHQIRPESPDDGGGVTASNEPPRVLQS